MFKQRKPNKTQFSLRIFSQITSNPFWLEIFQQSKHLHKLTAKSFHQSDRRKALIKPGSR